MLQPKPIVPYTCRAFVLAMAEYFEKDYNRIQADQVSRRLAIYTDYFRGLIFLTLINMDLKYVKKPVVTEVGLAIGYALENYSGLRRSRIYEGESDET